MTYEIWGTDSRNVVGSYPTQDAALTVVRASVAAYGREYVPSWTLLREDVDESVTFLAGGHEINGYSRGKVGVGLLLIGGGLF